MNTLITIKRMKMLRFLMQKSAEETLQNIELH